ncbi:MAG: hypothetical protein SGARI_006899, partial [Bacillariaceae sp.]
MAVSAVARLSLTEAFTMAPSVQRQQRLASRSQPQLYSDWSDFNAMDDDDDDEFLMSEGIAVDRLDYAKEEDSQEQKAQVGASLETPTIEGGEAEPIFLPPGSQMELSEENVLGILSACREEIGTLFGYTAENRGVGITGGVDF